MSERINSPIGEKQKILNFSSEKFFSEGFYKTTIDEIARSLHVSKNTIYKHFPTKEKLVWATIEYIISIISTKIKPVIDSNDNALIKLVKMLEILSGNIVRFTEKWMRDLQIHAPFLWEKVDSIRKRVMYDNISRIIRQGQKEKLFKDYPSELIITIFISSLRSIVNPQFLMNATYTSRDAVRNTFEILLNGILTKKGTSVFKSIKLPI